MSFNPLTNSFLDFALAPQRIVYSIFTLAQAAYPGG